MGESSISGQSTIIAAVCAEAPTDAVRDCLRKYDPTKSAWHIENYFKTEKKPVLVEALTYLRVPNMEDYIAGRLQNLFPDVCDLFKCKTMEKEIATHLYESLIQMNYSMMVFDGYVLLMTSFC